MSDAIFLGVDGGGTKTEFVCIDAKGDVIARAVTGTTYHLQVGLEEAVSRLQQGIAQVCAELGTTPAAITHTFFGLPAFGEDTFADAHIAAACGILLGHERYLCGNDAVCGWAGSLGCEDGINIVAGTGSIGYGEHGSRSARVGGWGEVFGDEGSAYWIAARGLALFSRMSDGRAPKGALHQRLTQALSLQSDLQLCEKVMGPSGLGRTELASLAPIVSAAAGEGDAGARAILDAAADELVALAYALVTQLDFPAGMPVPISWSGSVLSQEPLVRSRFLGSLDTAQFLLVEPRFAPGHGAALYARKRADMPGSLAAQRTAQGQAPSPA